MITSNFATQKQNEIPKYDYENVTNPDDTLPNWCNSVRSLDLTLSNILGSNNSPKGDPVKPKSAEALKSHFTQIRSIFQKIEVSTANPGRSLKPARHTVSSSH